LHGTVVANLSDYDDLHFLTSDGTYYSILKNKKFGLLKAKSNECLRIIANVFDIEHSPYIEVISFELDFPADRFYEDDKTQDEIVYSVSKDTFIDYESFM
jgi:hypothetical protein